MNDQEVVFTISLVVVLILILMLYIFTGSMLISVVLSLPAVFLADNVSEVRPVLGGTNNSGKLVYSDLQTVQSVSDKRQVIGYIEGVGWIRQNLLSQEPLSYKLVPLEGHTIDLDFFNSIDPVARYLLETGECPDVLHVYDAADRGTFYWKIDELSPRARYHRRNKDYKRTMNIKQIKLGAGELVFFTKAYEEFKASDKKKMVMVYFIERGYPHLNWLFGLFPDIDIVFVCPDPVEITCKNVEIIPKYMDESLCVSLHKRFVEDRKDTYLAFNCNISVESQDFLNQYNTLHYIMVKNNLDLQFQWWDYMQPHLASFKFNLSYEDGQTSYPKGELYTVPFTEPTTTETMLVVRENAEIIQYNHRLYEEQMFYHNKISKMTWFDNPLGEHLTIKNNMVDNCYDCVYIVTAGQEYLRKVKGIDKPSVEQMAEMVKSIQDLVVFLDDPNTYTIYSATVRAQNIRLEGILAQCYNLCHDPLCIQCNRMMPTKRDQFNELPKELQERVRDITAKREGIAKTTTANTNEIYAKNKAQRLIEGSGDTCKCSTCSAKEDYREPLVV